MVDGATELVIMEEMEMETEEDIMEMVGIMGMDMADGIMEEITIIIIMVTIMEVGVIMEMVVTMEMEMVIMEMEDAQVLVQEEMEMEDDQVPVREEMVVVIME